MSSCIPAAGEQQQQGSAVVPGAQACNHLELNCQPVQARLPPNFTLLWSASQNASSIQRCAWKHGVCCREQPQQQANRQPRPQVQLPQRTHTAACQHQTRKSPATRGLQGATPICPYTFEILGIMLQARSGAMTPHQKQQHLTDTAPNCRVCKLTLLDAALR